jgi:heme/copper-type cytochrome/quinol oxidase subunit 2
LFRGFVIPYFGDSAETNHRSTPGRPVSIVVQSIAMSPRVRFGLTALGFLLTGAVVRLSHDTAIAQSTPSGERTVSISARRYAFSPNRIEVVQDDLVRIELKTEDIAHSLTIDAYRIAKRISPGQPVTLEFRAEKAGTFPFYCNLQIDDGCRRMRGELIVKPRQ